jgi:hypothetical protein
VLHLLDGDLMVQARTSPGAQTTTGAITGGSGRYAGARGTYASRTVVAGSDDTITLLG